MFDISVPRYEITLGIRSKYTCVGCLSFLSLLTDDAQQIDIEVRGFTQRALYRQVGLNGAPAGCTLIKEYEDNLLVLSFQTLYSPPLGWYSVVLKQLNRRYCDLDIKLTYSQILNPTPDTIIYSRITLKG